MGLHKQHMQPMQAAPSCCDGARCGFLFHLSLRTPPPLIQFTALNPFVQPLPLPSCGTVCQTLLLFLRLSVFVFFLDSFSVFRLSAPTLIPSPVCLFFPMIHRSKRKAFLHYSHPNRSFSDEKIKIMFQIVNNITMLRDSGSNNPNS